MKEFIKHLHCGLIISPAPMSNAGIHPRASGEPLTAAFIRGRDQCSLNVLCAKIAWESCIQLCRFGDRNMTARRSGWESAAGALFFKRSPETNPFCARLCWKVELVKPSCAAPTSSLSTLWIYFFPFFFFVRINIFFWTAFSFFFFSISTRSSKASRAGKKKYADGRRKHNLYLAADLCWHPCR